MVAGMIRRYLFNILIAIDQLGNALRGGDPDETISSVAAKNPDKAAWKPLRWFLEFVDPGHLQRAIERDEGTDSIR